MTFDSTSKAKQPRLEPKLQLLEGESFRNKTATSEDDTRLDIKGNMKLQLLEGESFRNKTTTTEDDIRLDIKGKMTQGKTFSIIFFQTPC